MTYEFITEDIANETYGKIIKYPSKCAIRKNLYLFNFSCYQYKNQMILTLKFEWKN